jgi:hypothetical protein
MTTVEAVWAHSLSFGTLRVLYPRQLRVDWCKNKLFAGFISDQFPSFLRTIYFQYCAVSLTITISDPLQETTLRESQPQYCKLVVIWLSCFLKFPSLCRVCYNSIYKMSRCQEFSCCQCQNLTPYSPLLGPISPSRPSKLTEPQGAVSIIRFHSYLL